MVKVQGSIQSPLIGLANRLTSLAALGTGKTLADFNKTFYEILDGGISVGEVNVAIAFCDLLRKSPMADRADELARGIIAAYDDQTEKQKAAAEKDLRNVCFFAEPLLSPQHLGLRLCRQQQQMDLRWAVTAYLVQLPSTGVAQMSVARLGKTPVPAAELKFPPGFDGRLSAHLVTSAKGFTRVEIDASYRPEGSTKTMQRHTAALRDDRFDRIDMGKNKEVTIRWERSGAPSEPTIYVQAEDKRTHNKSLASAVLPPPPSLPLPGGFEGTVTVTDHDAEAETLTVHLPQGRLMSMEREQTYELARNNDRVVLGRWENHDGDVSLYMLVAAAEE